MSLNLGVMSAAVTLDDSEYRRTLSGLEGRSETSFRKIAQLAAGYLTFRGIVSSGSMAIKTFSDMEEAANRFNAVYSDIQGMATTTMQALRKEFGLSRKSATEMLAGTGDLLTGFGFDQGSALKLSEQAAKLGADLYSFTNYKGGAKGATEALTKAMLGETEQIKALGIVIRQDSDEYKNLVAQYQKTQGATEQQAKALAVLKMATDQSKNAIGDWNRPGETFAQVAQSGKEQAIEFASVMGNQFQEPVKNAMKTVGGLVQKYNEADPATQRFITGSVALGAGLLLTQTSAVKAANAKAILAGRYLLTANSAAREAAIVKANAAVTVAAEKDREAAAVSAAARKEFCLKKIAEENARAAHAEAIAAVESSKAQLQKAEADSSALAATQRNDKIREAITVRQLARDKAEIASAKARELAIAQTLLREQMVYSEKARYQYTLQNGSSAGYRPDPALAQSQAQVNALTKEYAAAQKAAAAASVTAANARAAAVAAGKIDSITTKELTTAKTALSAAEKRAAVTTKSLAAARNQAVMATTRHAVAERSAKTATDAHIAAQLLANKAKIAGGRASLVLSNGLRVAGASLKAFFVSMGPIGWAMIAFSGLAAVVNRLKAQAEAAAEKAKDAADKARAHDEDTGGKHQSLSLRMQRLEKLQEYEKLNNNEMVEAAKILEELGVSQENAGKMIDKTTGRFNLQRESLKGLIEEKKKQMEQEKIAALQERAKKIGEQIDANENKKSGSTRGFFEGMPIIGYFIDSVDEANAPIEKENNALYAERFDILRQISEIKEKGYDIDKKTNDEITATSEEIRKLQERLKNKNFSIKLDGIDTAAEKLPVVAAKIKELENEKLQARGDQKKELEAKLKLLEMKQEYLSLVKEQKKEQKAIRDIESDNSKLFENRKKKLAETAVDRSIDKKLRDGDTTGAKSIMEAEYTRAREAARKMREEYRVAYRAAIADGYLTEREKENLAELKSKMQEQWSKGDKYKNMLYDQEKNDTNKQKVVVSYSLAMLAQNSPQERTVKLLEKSYKTQEKIAANTKTQKNKTDKTSKVLAT